MTILVTGSAGHLGEALMRTLPLAGHQAVELDFRASPFTHQVGSVVDRGFVRGCLHGVGAVLHTATLHKPHVVTHRHQDFVDDIVAAHLCALERAPSLGFGRYIVSATTPFSRDDLRELGRDAPAVVRRRVPRYEAIYAARGWSMFPGLDRVYVNERARSELGWRPRYDFGTVIDRIAAGDDYRSPLARTIGSKGYHDVTFEEGPYPTAPR